ncbi:MAG: hypothetical protein IJY09_11165 [Lachnospiraceae bacterium]|nr:hypothetical protein [Lachnospiraceae bacterium]
MKEEMLVELLTGLDVAFLENNYLEQDLFGKGFWHSLLKHKVVVTGILSGLATMVVFAALLLKQKRRLV